MFTGLLFKDLRMTILPRRYWVYFTITISLLIGSMALQCFTYIKKQENYTQLMSNFAAERNQLYDLTGLMKVGAPYAIAPQKLQIICQGTEALGSKISIINNFIWQTDKLPLIRTENNSNPLLGFFPHLDVTTMFTFIISLMVIAFSFQTVAGEKETGTLKLMLSYPVSRAKIILAKVASGYIAILLPIIFSFVVSLLILQFLPFIVLIKGDIFTLLAIYGFGCIYLLAIYLLGVGVSAGSRRSSTAIAILLLVWLFFIIVVHNVTLLVTESSNRDTSVYKIMQSMTNSYKVLSDRIQQEGEAHFGKETVDNDLQKPYWRREHLGLYVLETCLLADLQREKISEYYNDIEYKNNLLNVVSNISPSLLFTTSATDLAGTGVNSYLRQGWALLDFHGYYTHQLLRNAADNEKKQGNKWKYLAGGSSWLSSVKPFQPEIPSFGERLQANIFRFAILCVYMALFFIGAVFIFIKSEIS